MVSPCPCLEGLDLLKLAEALLKAFTGLSAPRPLVFRSVFSPLGAAALLRLRIFTGLAPIILVLAEINTVRPWPRRMARPKRAEGFHYRIQMPRFRPRDGSVLGRF